jgi:hypothetical protein
VSNPFEREDCIEPRDYKQYLDEKLAPLIHPLGFSEAGYFVDEQHFGNVIAEFESDTLAIRIVFDRGFPRSDIKPKNKAEWDWFGLGTVLSYLDKSYRDSTDFSCEHELHSLAEHYKEVEELLTGGPDNLQEDLEQFGDKQFRALVSKLAQEAADRRTNSQ